MKKTPIDRQRAFQQGTPHWQYPESLVTQTDLQWRLACRRYRQARLASHQIANKEDVNPRDLGIWIEENFGRYGDEDREAAIKAFDKAYGYLKETWTHGYRDEKLNERERQRRIMQTLNQEVVDYNKDNKGLRERDAKIAAGRAELQRKIEALDAKMKKDAEEKRKKEEELAAEEQRLEKLERERKHAISAASTSTPQPSTSGIQSGRRQTRAEEEKESEEEETEDDEEYETEEEEEQELAKKEDFGKGSKDKSLKKPSDNKRRGIRQPAFKPKSSTRQDVARILEQAEDQAREMGMSQQQAASFFETLESKLVNVVKDPRRPKPKKGRRRRYSSDSD